MLNFLLNKGGAGVSLSRQETVERINPLIEKHIALLYAYDALLRHLSDPEVTTQLEAFQRVARADIGKLSETVLSAGGISYNGADIEPGSVNLGADEPEMLAQLQRLEQEFLDLVAAEFKLKHQIRTQAILANVRTHSQERLNYLDALARGRRPASRR